MLPMVCYSRRPQSGQITCYFKRTYHVLPTFDAFCLDKLISRVHNRRCNWGEGQPLRSRSSPVLSAAPTPPDIASRSRVSSRRWSMVNILWKAWLDDQAQDIAEYAVMLAVILVVVIGTIRLVGSNANNVFSSVASSVQ